MPDCLGSDGPLYLYTWSKVVPSHRLLPARYQTSDMVAEGPKDPREEKKKTTNAFRNPASLSNICNWSNHPRVKERENKLFVMMGEPYLI